MSISWLQLYLFTAFLKLLLFHSYHSTDFEVHRNWLAITNTLPISQWYYDETSPWTLDYPPFFAWFEYALSHIAKLFDPDIVKLSNLNYSSDLAKLFQRVSVILSDIVLCVACARAGEVVTKNRSSEQDDLITKAILVVCYLFNAGLVIVDHIHFQYNGFLSGIFLLSLVNLMEGNIVKSGLYYAVLLNFKHVYLYVAPAYFVYMLKYHINNGRGICGLDIVGLAKLGAGVVAVFAVSFGPFIDHLPQIASRLFPVHRGLCHAYWAPNFWCLYNVVDVVSAKVLKLAGILPNNGTHPLLSGLVQVSDFVVLPNITTLHCTVLTLVAMTPAIYRLRSGSPTSFLKTATICALSAYMFGYQVHEKAILVVLIPYALLVFADRENAQNFMFLSLAGTYSLFPLLFQIRELPLKLCIFVMAHSVMYLTLQMKYTDFKFSRLESLYLWGMAVHFVAVEILLPLLLPQLEFLPLIMMSLYCMFGVSYGFVRLYETL